MIVDAHCLEDLQPSPAPTNGRHQLQLASTYHARAIPWLRRHGLACSAKHGGIVVVVGHQLHHQPLWKSWVNTLLVIDPMINHKVAWGVYYGIYCINYCSTVLKKTSSTLNKPELVDTQPHHKLFSGIVKDDIYSGTPQFSFSRSQPTTSSLP